MNNSELQEQFEEKKTTFMLEYDKLKLTGTQIVIDGNPANSIEDIFEWYDKIFMDTDYDYDLVYFEYLDNVEKIKNQENINYKKVLFYTAASRLAENKNKLIGPSYNKVSQQKKLKKFARKSKNIIAIEDLMIPVMMRLNLKNIGFDELLELRQKIQVTSKEKVKKLNF